MFWHVSRFSWFHSNPSGSAMPYMSWLWEESWVMEVVPSSVICTFRFPLKKMKPHLNCSNHISLYIVCVLCAFRQAGPIDPCLRDQANILSIPGFIKKLISIVLKPFVSASHLCLIKQSVVLNRGYSTECFSLVLMFVLFSIHGYLQTWMEVLELGQL